MKKIIYLLVSLLSVSAIAQQRQVSAMFTHSTFNIPGEMPYVETYLWFDAWSLEFVPSGNKYQATVEIEIAARQGDSIRYAKKYSLNSPAIDNPSNDQFHFLDLQRFSLGNGIYELQVTVNDKNTSTKPQTISDTLYIAYPATSPSLSSIQLMSDATPTKTENMLSRGGYDMVPYTNSFVPESMKSLSYYFEIYNIQNEIKNDIFATHAYLETLETGRKVAGSDQYTRHTADTIVPEYSTMDISSIASGNYNLVVEVVNKNNELLLFRKFPFQRSNPSVAYNPEAYRTIEYTDSNFATHITDNEKLTYYVKGLWPIANTEERRFISNCSKISLEEKQYFMFMFWAKRNDHDPESAWEDYRQKLQLVEKEFGYGKTPGYATDRGRVYLQYGPPNHIIDERHKVSVRNYETQGQVFYFPYQMWRYDMLPADEPKRMFVFFDEFQSGDFKLLHSNARGEVQDMLWERRLSRNMLEEYVQGEAGQQFERGY